VRARYKCVAQKVKPVPLSYGSTPEAGLDWRGTAISRAIPVPGSGDECCIPKISHGARGGRLTPETLRKLQIGSISRPKQKDALLGMLSNREYAHSWRWEELGTISDEVEPPHHIRLESGHKVWKDCVFCAPKKVILVEKEMIEERVRQGLFEPAWGPYKNAHFLVPKNNGKYHFIISAVSADRHTLKDSRIPPNVEQFSEAFAWLPISPLIDIHSGYDQKMLHEECRDYMAFETTQCMYRPTRRVPGATNWVSAFVSVSRKILNTHLGSITEIFAASAKNISVRAEWLRQSGRAPSELSETPCWRITPRPVSIPRVALHIALRSPFRRFFLLCPSPILNKHSGFGANCDHTSEWVHWVHACIGIAMGDAAKISTRVPSTLSSRSVGRR